MFPPLLSFGSSSSTTTTTTKLLKPQMSDVSRPRLTSTRIHIMALDGIVNVNSMFTFAVFLGLAWYPTTDPANTLIGSDAAACAAGSDIAEDLIAFHVYSFSSFLFSSLIALALKQAIKISKAGGGGDEVGRRSRTSGEGEMRNITMEHLNIATLRVGILVSAIGSVFGCGFLMMALVDLVQIKLGTLACGNLYTFAAIGPLVILVPSALVIFVFLVIHAFIR